VARLAEKTMRRKLMTSCEVFKLVFESPMRHRLGAFGATAETRERFVQLYAARNY